MMANTATTSLSDFQIIAKIGDGSFSQVFKVKRKQDGQIYALKKIRMTRIKEKDRDNALNEVRILASQQGEHIVQFKQSFYDHQAAVLYIIMEYAEKGDLLKFVQNYARKNTKIEEEQIWKALVHITRGLKTLHDMKIVHRDLKGANVFITENGTYKLGDLNVSKVIKNDLARTQTGTPYYASPEVWKDQPYGTKSDMWSLGCVIYQMAAHRPPFTAPDIQILYKKIMTGYYSRIPSIYSNELSDVIASLLTLDPKDRPSSSELLRNPAVLRNFNDDSSNEGFDWQNNELLSTIKLPQRNYRIISEILPKAQYDKKRRMSVSKQEDTIVSNFFKQKEQLPKKEESSIISKERIKSLYNKQNSSRTSFRISKRQRIVTNMEPAQKTEESSIHNIAIFRQIPNSGKPIKKTECSKMLYSPITSKLEPKKEERAIEGSMTKPVTTICRKKFKSFISKVCLTSSRGDKQNLRRAGQNVVGGQSSRRGIRPYI